MIQRTPGIRRSFALLALAAGTALSAPAIAQDNQAAPPVLQGPPAPAQTQPAPAPTPAPAQTTPPVVTPERVTPPPVVRTVTPRAEAPAESEAAPPRRTSTPARTAAPEPQAEAAPAPATPEAAPAPVAAPPAAIGNEVAPEPGFNEVAPVAEPAADTVDPAAAEKSGRGFPIYLVGAVLVLLAAIAGLVLFLRSRRRKRDEMWDQPHTIALDDGHPVEEPYVDPAPVAAEPEPAYVEPEPEPAPVRAGPAIGTAGIAGAAAAVADPVALAEAEAAPENVAEAEAAEPVVETEEVAAEQADVDALAAAAVPSDDRPWLEFALRPVRAGTNVVDAVVEFELTVGNAGAVAAEDVRVAAWLLSASPNQDADIERFLAEPPSEAVMPGFDVAPGDGRRVDATISLPKAGLNVVTARDRPFFVPMVVADARYVLPGGGEGRTSAAFVVGTTKDGAEKLGPIWLDRGPRMHEDIEARLHGEPTRA